MFDNFADWKSICETKYRSCRSLDGKDWSGYADCFTHDVVLDTPPAGNITEGRDTVVTKVRSLVGASFTSHLVYNGEITFTDTDSADVIWALRDRVIWSPDRQAALGYAAHSGYASYVERYVRCTDNTWRIARQTLRYSHMDIDRP